MIGYYVHHHGMGHMNRAHSIAAQLDEPVTVLSSRRPGPTHAAADWLQLPLDTDDHLGLTTGGWQSETAHGAFHWAPLGVSGLTDRMHALAEWVGRVRPTAVIVDVSVEVSVYLRLMGVRVVVMAMPGVRTDDAHQLAYRVADRIVAPWAQQVYDPSWLHPYADKTVYVGAISRFDGRDRPSAEVSSTVVVLSGAGGTSVVAEDIRSAAETIPQMTWHPVGLEGSPWIDDVWPTLCTAAVVVSHAGQNSIADLACAGRPAIIVPQCRPFDEQISTAEALHSARIAETVPRWPQPHEWPDLIERAQSTDSTRWQKLEGPGSAKRAADAVMALT